MVPRNQELVGAIGVCSRNSSGHHLMPTGSAGRYDETYRGDDRKVLLLFLT